jgi:hypothetical protein
MEISTRPFVIQPKRMVTPYGIGIINAANPWPCC